MSTPHTAVDFTQLYESAKGYLELADDIDRVDKDLEDNASDDNLWDGFGRDGFGAEAFSNVQRARQAGHALFTGTKGMVGGAGQNLATTAQEFKNSNDVNESLAKKSSFHPHP